MKKLIHAIFCYKILPVTDATTGKKENATYRLFCGFPFKITYKSV